MFSIEDDREFRIGDRVRCINISPIKGYPAGELTVNKIYAVIDMNGRGDLMLEGERNFYWRKERFVHV